MESRQADPLQSHATVLITSTRPEALLSDDASGSQSMSASDLQFCYDEDFAIEQDDAALVGNSSQGMEPERNDADIGTPRNAQDASTSASGTPQGTEALQVGSSYIVPGTSVLSHPAALMDLSLNGREQEASLCCTPVDWLHLRTCQMHKFCCSTGYVHIG